MFNVRAIGAHAFNQTRDKVIQNFRRYKPPAGCRVLDERIVDDFHIKILAHICKSDSLLRS
jgi:hypothetical protein